jgi:hypothetical protein
VLVDLALAQHLDLMVVETAQMPILLPTVLAVVVVPQTCASRHMH